MITKLVKLHTPGSSQNEFYCLSTDDKNEIWDMCARNADLVIEMDTRKVFLVDEENHRFLDQ